MMTSGFCLKVYPQREYFGKKGMSNVDVFFTKSSGQLEKLVYLTLVFRCDQSKLETMNIADNVLGEFSKDYCSIQILEYCVHIICYINQEWLYWTENPGEDS